MDGYYEDCENWSEDLYESHDESDKEQDEYRRRRRGIVIRTSGSSDEEYPRSPRVPLKSLPSKAFYSKRKSSTTSSSCISRRHKHTHNGNETPARTDKENQATKQSAPVSSVDEVNTVEQLKKTNKLLGELLDRVKSTEDRLKGLEDKCLSSPLSSSSSGSTPKRSNRKREVPREVRQEVRRVYAVLLEEDEEFNGWSLGQGHTFRDAENQAVLDRLLKEVKSLNPEYISMHIRDAAYRFYRSRSEEESIDRRGLASDKLIKKRRHERIVRKLNERKSALDKMAFTTNPDRQRERWHKVLKFEIMSSEESGQDDETREEFVVVKPLPWRSTEVNSFLLRLDQHISEIKSPQARRQTKKRVEGGISTRPLPGGNFPTWTFAEV